MKYIKQFGIIMGITLLAEVIKNHISLPVPTSIYGLIIMLLVLITGVIKLEHVKETGKFFIEIMPLMFIPAAVGLIDAWYEIKAILVPVAIIVFSVNVIVFVVTGKTVQLILQRKEGTSR